MVLILILPEKLIKLRLNRKNNKKALYTNLTAIALSIIISHKKAIASFSIFEQ